MYCVWLRRPPGQGVQPGVPQGPSGTEAPHPDPGDAHNQGEVYFKAVMNQLRDHGFMAKWTEAECAELVKDTIYRAQRR